MYSLTPVGIEKHQKWKQARQQIALTKLNTELAATQIWCVTRHNVRSHVLKGC